MKTLLKFQSPSCVPCKHLSAALQSLQQEQPELFSYITTSEICTDTERSLTKQYGVRSVPTLILLDCNNAEINRTVGSVSKVKLKEFLSE